MEKGLHNADSILCHLRRSRANNKDLLEIARLVEHVEKHGCESKAQQHRIIDELVRLLTGYTFVLDTEDGACTTGCVTWMTHMQEHHKLPLLSDLQFDNVAQWLLKCLESDGSNMELVSRICTAFEGMFTTHPANTCECFVSIGGRLQNYLTWDSSIAVIINVLRCLDKMIIVANDAQFSKGNNDVSAEIGAKLLRMFYGDDKPTVETDVIPVFLTLSLQLLQRISSINVEFAKHNITELLGLSRAHFHYGVGDMSTTITTPQKVYVSQQALYDSAEEFEVNINSEKSRISGGKTPKARKPRLVARSGERTVVIPSLEWKTTLSTFDVKTSDSDMSEPENGANRVLYERNRMAKIRLSSINLVSSIVRTIERKLIYGYWHALFPSGTGETADNLLYIGQHDPNMRCRCAALQVCAQLLYGSKGFLHQADINVKRCPTTFIPFSVSLGLTVLAIYRELSTILSTESSLPALTQALKCLAVLVQATPFQKFEEGFVQRLVSHVRPLIYHRDVAVQVSALMVMEFLVSSSDAAPYIAETFGLPHTIRTAIKTGPLGDEDHDIIDIEEFVESDCSDTDDMKPVGCMSNTDGAELEQQGGPSWLLLRVLHNLGENNNVVATSIRIESLQVLIAISSHFFMLKQYLPQVCEVLQHALDNTLSDVRLYAARCIDTCAYQIGRYVLENSTVSASSETKIFSKFWSQMMTIIMDHIRRDREEMGTVRVTLCDALSNIGVVMFENCSHSLQISLLSFLSGVSSDCSDDAVVRAAAVRALAVYVLYPSMRGDLVFVENTADLTLRLVTDTNLLVRVKAFWALGNISDALIGKIPDGNENNDRISNELLFRMVCDSTTACSDNDKVRCNAVRTLGNLLRLLTYDHFRSNRSNMNWQQTFEKAICKLTDCLRSSGNAKVKWNTCYAISNIMRNHTIFRATDLNWQSTLFSAICHVIVHNSNFKVRINAASAITSISERTHFGSFYEQFWSSILEAIEQSYNMDNFHEYNHRDNLQDQLCLALAHLLNCSTKDDWYLLKKRLSLHVDTIERTWKRVVLRMVPEKAAPLLSCHVILMENGKRQQSLSFDQKNAIDFLVNTFSIE